MLDVQQFENEVRKRVVVAFDRAEAFVEGLRPVLHNAVNDLRQPVVNFVTNAVDSALEIRERSENLVATVTRDARAVRQQAQEWVKKFIRS